jgi:dimethylhistidine N-methyltransferase
VSSLATAPDVLEPSLSVLEAAALEAVSQEGLAQEAVSQEAVAHEAAAGLTATPRTLAPWLFYDESGSKLFEQITQLPEYYLTRTERAIFAAHADEILSLAAGTRCLTLAELGAGTATKTGILLRAAVRRQSHVTYQPIDVSESCLIEARESLESTIPGITVRPQLANYITQSITIMRPPQARILALYIGSSIGNFSPVQAREILCNLRAQLEPGDSLLLGTDLAPGPHKSPATLLAAYDDAAGVTAAFNLNILKRLNRELGADFDTAHFVHRAIWNARASRIEMHLESTSSQRVTVPANAASPELRLHFMPSETIHTENSYKFTRASVAALLGDSGFIIARTFTDEKDRFAVTLATAI